MAAGIHDFTNPNVTNSNEKMIARRVILGSPFRNMVEHRKALYLDDVQASAHLPLAISFGKLWLLCGAFLEKNVRAIHHVRANG